MLKRLVNQYYPTILLLILFFAFVTRIIWLYRPAGYVFDEVYHVVTSRLIAENNPDAFDPSAPPPEENTAVDWLHPPVAKYTQAFFIKTLGDNAFSWRFSSALFGVGVIWLTAVLAKNLFRSKSVGLLAAFLASLDGLLLTMSRITMNDIHVTFFILLTLVFHLKHRKVVAKTDKVHFLLSKWLILSGITGGVALATKWSGLFVIVFTFGIEFLFLVRANLYRFKEKKQLKFVKSTVQLGYIFILIPLAIYVSSYWMMFLQGGTLIDLVDMHQQIWHYQTTLSATHPGQSVPLDWFLDLKPVWFAVDRDLPPGKIANIYAFGNPALFWLGDLAVLLTIACLMRVRTKLKHFWQLTYLLLAYGVVWLPWQLSPRIMFFYHYTPAVPLLAIILSYWLVVLLREKKIMVLRYLSLSAIAVIIASFVIWFPHWTYMPVTTKFANRVYFAINTWKYP